MPTLPTGTDFKHLDIETIIILKKINLKKGHNRTGIDPAPSRALCPEICPYQGITPSGAGSIPKAMCVCRGHSDRLENNDLYNIHTDPRHCNDRD